MTIDLNRYKLPLGRVAVIGAGDLGSHVARALVAHGASGALLTGNSRMEMVNALKDELALHIPAVALQLGDLSDAVLSENVLEQAEKELGGPIDKIVITVAYQPKTAFDDETPEIHQKVHSVNFVGPYFFAKRALERAKKQGTKLHVVLVSSDNSYATEFDPNTPHYDTSKAALNHSVNHLAFPYAKDGLQVNAVLPGWIGVASQENVVGLEEIYASIAMGRPATPEEVAIGIVNLLSEPHITGTVRVIANGGGTNRAHLRKDK